VILALATFSRLQKTGADSGNLLRPPFKAHVALNENEIPERHILKNI
jgi:hypothetical protein